MIQLTSISKIFNHGKSNEFIALKDVSANIARNKLTILKGSSGSGKTTLLSLIGCMSRPTSGRINLKGIKTSFFNPDASEEGLDISSLPERFLTEIRRDSFGFIFQQFNLIKGISALENIMLPAYPSGKAHSLISRKALELMETFSIARHKSSPVEWLSGGELQRVAIARAMINSPSIIIADEPTAHLDSKLSEDFMEIITGLKAEGRTVIIASHDPLVYNSRYVDAVISMRDGCITEHNEPK